MGLLVDNLSSSLYALFAERWCSRAPGGVSPDTPYGTKEVSRNAGT